MTPAAPVRAEIVKRFQEALVRIEVTGNDADGRPVRQRVGSGVIVDSDGVILTAKHVIGDDTEWQETAPGSKSPRRTIKVTGLDEKRRKVELGTASASLISDYDVAVLFIPGQHLTAAPLSSEEPPEHSDVVALVWGTEGVPEAVEVPTSYTDPHNQNLLALRFKVKEGQSGSGIFDAQHQLTGIILSDAKDGEHALALPIARVKDDIRQRRPRIRESGGEPRLAPSMALAHVIQWRRNAWPKMDDLVSDTLVSEPFVDQNTAFQTLRDAISRRESGTYVLTGHGGTGKSTVLRKLAFELASEFISSTSDDGSPQTPLPVLVSLNRIELDQKVLQHFARGAGTPAVLWEGISASWTRFATDVIRLMEARKHVAAAVLDSQWLDDVRSGSNVLMFDALDEFLNRYCEITIEDIIELGAFLRLDPAIDLNTPLVLIFCGRLGTEGWNLWDLQHPKKTLRLTSISRHAANRIFGEANVDRLLNGLGQSYESEAVLTPLILHTLLGGGQWERGKNPTRVCEAALEALLSPAPRMQQDKTPHRNDRGTQHDDVSLPEQMGALTAVGWAFTEDEMDQKYLNGYYPHRGFDEILSRTKHIAEDWQDTPEGTHGRRGAEMLSGFALAADNHGLKALLRHSVFDYTGHYKFTHRTWMETCIARYIAFSIDCRRFEALRTRTYYPEIFQGIGELVQRPLDAELIGNAIDEARTTQFIIGNIAAIIGRSFVEIDGLSLKQLHERLVEIGPLARHVLIASLGYRAAKKAPDDASHDTIFRALYPEMLEQCMSESRIPERNPLTASLAWCFDKLLAQSANGKYPRRAWPEPRSSDEKAIFDLACPGHKDGQASNLKVRSLQSGYVRAVQGAISDPYRLIAAAHFLLMLAVSESRRVSSNQTDSELRKFLKPSGELATTIRNFSDVPELARLFEVAGKVYNRESW